MDSLKNELRESFIKPLKFKFLVEKLRKEKLSHPELDSGSSSNQESKKINEDTEMNSV